MTPDLAPAETLTLLPESTPVGYSGLCTSLAAMYKRYIPRPRPLTSQTKQ